MTRMGLRRGAFAGFGGVALSVALVVGSATTSVCARADETPSAERLKAAAEEFDRGRRAFIGKEYEGAATHFENAYRDAPRAETLRLAIRARREAKQLARAASLAAVANEKYASDEPTAKLSREVLAEAGPVLHAYEIECRPECSITTDGRVATQTDAEHHRLFLDPGPHELGVSFKTGSVSRKLEARRGGKEQLAFEAPAALPPVVAPPPPSTAEPTTTNAQPATKAPVLGPSTTPARDGGASSASPKPLGPVLFFVGLGVTAALGAGTIVSGIAATNDPGTDAVRKACAGKDESCPAYQDGKSAETRTNILLGATIGAAVVTGVIGVFFTQWSKPSGNAVKVGGTPLPGGAALSTTVPF